MALTVTEAQAVFELMHWLADTPLWRAGDQAPKVSDERALEHLQLLAQHAGRRLQLTIPTEHLERAIGHHQAAESDGAAQAVCRAIDAHLAHNGSLPWPSIRRPYDEWAEIQGRMR
jgi:hypothetical protein